MTVMKHNAKPIDFKALLAEERDFMKTLMKEALQEVLEAEMTEQLGAALTEMYVQGVPTRKMKAITEALCGYPFSAPRNPIPISSSMPATSGCGRGGVIRAQAVLLAIGIHHGGRREMRAMELAPRESEAHWRDTKCL